VSAYDYYNFVMNRNGKLKTWGDSVFARKLVSFANIEVTPNPGGLAGVLGKLHATFGEAPYHYWGAQRPADYSPDRDRQDHRGSRPRPAQVEEAVLHLVGPGGRRTARTSP